MMNQVVTIEEFRKLLANQYIQKGLKPPIQNGEKEKQLYQNWIQGVKKLQGNS